MSLPPSFTNLERWAEGNLRHSARDMVFDVRGVPPLGGVPPPGVPVYTGDSNCDSSIDISDAICILGHLFGASDDPCKSPCCMANMDTNNDDAVDIADGINILSFLFDSGNLTAPDGTLIAAGQDGCFLYPVEEVILECANECTLP